jgi:predicted enzyme involved in methoxymalonyl-ACP biosynthesis
VWLSRPASRCAGVAAEEQQRSKLERLRRYIKFNVTTRHYTETQIRAIAQSQQAWLAAFRMADRMGSSGRNPLIPVSEKPRPPLSMSGHSRPPN